MFYKGKYQKPSAPVAMGSIMMRVACVLLVMVMVSIHMMSGLYARYITSGSGEDAARVAKFDVDVTGTPDAIEIDCTQSTDGSLTITVTNKSEVAVRYDVIVAFKNDIPGVSTMLDTAAGAVDSLTTTYSNAGTLAVGAASQAHELSFHVDTDAFTQSADGGLIYEQTLEFTVTIHVVQVD